MKRFYFVGGPMIGRSEEFYMRLQEVGGPPEGWRVYPHATVEGKALHIVEAVSLENILNHLQHFAGIYEWNEIVEILEAPP